MGPSKFHWARLGISRGHRLITLTQSMTCSTVALAELEYGSATQKGHDFHRFPPSSWGLMLHDTHPLEAMNSRDRTM
jgi:hypothetical protein